MFSKVIFFLFFFLSLSFSFAQVKVKMKTNKWRPTERDSMLRAQLLFEESNYGMAIPIFERILKNHPDELYLKYMNGLCGLYRSDKHGEALKYLMEVFEKNKKTAEIEFDLAKACHLNYKFDEAIAFLDDYKKRVSKLEPKRLKEIELIKDYCNNGKKLVANALPANITNIGGPINTEASEYVPVISSDESVMIFTYRGKKSAGGLQNGYNEADPYGIYYEDVFISYKDSTNNFEEPKSIGFTINGISNDAAVALSAEGHKLFVFKDDGSNGGDLYMSTLTGKDWSVPERLAGDVNSGAWEGSCSLASDGKTLFFTSERKGGYGGKDIYTSRLQPDGSWGTAINMGDKINTPYDDDAPFIHPDGRILVYSSKGKNSMGGYDVFRAVFNPSDSSWSDPENMGYPINSPDDDIYYVLTADGKTGYYSSGKVDGQGLQDIYKISPGLIGLTPFLALLKGTITLDGVPVEGKVIVGYETKTGQYADVVSNSSSGKYLVNLPGGDIYKVTFKYEGQKDQVKSLDLSAIVGYTEKVIDINFSTILPDTIKDIATITNPINPIKPDSSGINKINENDPNKNKKTGDETVEGLIFKVQIAAFRMPANYNYNKIKHLGKVEQLDLDGIVRFTIGGEFYSLNSANDQCKKVRYAGQTDAFVTAMYNGKRVYLEQLEKDGIIPALPK